MNKVNIANYIVYDLANRFNFAEHHEMDSELVGMVADNWHKSTLYRAPKTLNSTTVNKFGRNL